MNNSPDTAMLRREFLTALAVVGISSALGMSASFGGKPAVFTGVIEGVAAGGYDVVAYQAQAAAVVGDELITVERDRGGSGNLDSLDKWNFCLRSA